MAIRLNGSGRLLWVFGVLSLAAVATGGLVCARSGVPTGVWLRNLAAWGVGALVAGGVAAAGRAGAAPVALLAAPVGLLATLGGPAQEGVHRWLRLGPLHINVAMLLLPSAVVALAVLGRDRRWPWGGAFIALVLLLLQPDASQATALGACLGLLAARAAWPVALRGALLAVAGVLMAATWLRPDPLKPVPEVEEIIGLASAVSPLVAGLAVLLLAAVVAAPIVATRSAPPTPRLAGGALSLCLLLWVTTPLLGVFPVPWVGIGMSPILGAWLGVGLLAALLRRPPG
jgi:hypothetical protein